MEILTLAIIVRLDRVKAMEVSYILLCLIFEPHPYILNRHCLCLVYVSSATGSTYSGFFENNVKHGHGVLIHPLGKYVGEFVNDSKEGEGTLIFNDASSYNGGFKNNRFHGRGTLCTKDNNTYIGDWYHGLKHGQGSETLPDGRYA